MCENLKLLLKPAAVLPSDSILSMFRRETRPVMAEHGVIGWLAGQLGQIDAMPLSSLESCGALLMNLAMAKAGRRECHQVKLAFTHFACHHHM